MTTCFAMIRDINGYNSFLLPANSTDYAVDLAANTEKTLTVPNDSTKWIAVFCYEPGATVWVSLNATATLPGSNFASTTSKLNSPGYEVRNGDVIHFITANTTANVGVQLYAYR